MQGKSSSLPRFGSQAICFVWIDWVKNMMARDNSGLKTNLAITSTEFCQCKFDERDIGRGLGSGCGHRARIPPHTYILDDFVFWLDAFSVSSLQSP